MHLSIRDWPIHIRSITFSGLTTLSYIFDIIFYSILFTLSAVLGTIIPPRFHEFSLFDISLRYTYKTEAEAAIPLPLLVFISGGIPLIQFVLFALFQPNLSLTRRFWDLLSGFICLLGAMATQLMATCILKNICGLPRPDMIDRCEPLLQNIPMTQLSNVAICTQPDWNLVQEGFRSFPSGHSSAVFCGMIITSLNISAKLQTFDNRNNSFKVFLTIIPILLAMFVACTRVSDNRHFLRDVIVGSLIGVYVGSLFYWQYFPSVYSLRNNGRAYPPRRIGIHSFFNNIGGFWKIPDTLKGSFQERVLNGQEGEQYLTQLQSGYLNQTIVPTTIK
ncbi:putative diacylglycerol pyrophosphate phosphatase 1 [Spathaspora sp. JA1]|nr:putative diacylglycerol pyrophosphate phosphatase 1 [Spathaspora sp. JA1]